MKKHSTRCENAESDKKMCKCSCKGMLHGDKNKYKPLIEEELCDECGKRKVVERSYFGHVCEKCLNGEIDE